MIIFSDHLRRAAELNARPKRSWTAGVTPLADYLAQAPGAPGAPGTDYDGQSTSWWFIHVQLILSHFCWVEQLSFLAVQQKSQPSTVSMISMTYAIYIYIHDKWCMICVYIIIYIYIYVYIYDMSYMSWYMIMHDTWYFMVWDLTTYIANSIWLYGF